MNMPAAHTSMVDLMTLLDRLGVEIPIASPDSVRQAFYRFRVESKVVYAVKENNSFKVVRYSKN